MMKACGGPLTMTAAVEIAREYTAATAHMKEVGEETSESIHEI